jgi:hypothetical protein
LSRSNTGHLLVSSDRGVTWESKSIPDTSFDAIPYLAAVHPRDPAKIFVRIDGRIFSDVDGLFHAHDAVLYSADAGDTWTELQRAEGKALGFALSPDGSRLLVGFGSDGALAVDEAALGAFASSTEQFAFTRLVEGSVTCLAWTERGVYVCTPQSKAGRELAFSPSTSLGPDGAEFRTLLRLPEVKGPLSCCDAKAATVCKEAWSTTCSLLQACADARSTDDCAHDAGSGRGTDARVDTIGSGPDSSTSNVSTAGCSCRAGTARTTRNAPWWAGYWGVLLLFRAGAMTGRRIGGQTRRSPRAR